MAPHRDNLSDDSPAASRGKQYDPVKRLSPSPKASGHDARFRDRPPPLLLRRVVGRTLCSCRPDWCASPPSTDPAGPHPHRSRWWDRDDGADRCARRRQTAGARSDRRPTHRPCPEAYAHTPHREHHDHGRDRRSLVGCHGKRRTTSPPKHQPRFVVRSGVHCAPRGANARGRGGVFGFLEGTRHNLPQPVDFDVRHALRSVESVLSPEQPFPDQMVNSDLPVPRYFQWNQNWGRRSLPATQQRMAIRWAVER